MELKKECIYRRWTPFKCVVLDRPSVPLGDGADLILKFIGQIFFGQSPFPVIPDGGRLIHAAAVIKPHVILYRDDAGLGVAPHYQRDEGLV